MAASNIERIRRLREIRNILPVFHSGNNKAGLTAEDVKNKLELAIGSETPVLRTIQRDLKELNKNGEICVINTKPPKYFFQENTNVLNDENLVYVDVSQAQTPNDLSRILRGAQRQHLDFPDQDNKIEILQDTLRLIPARIDRDILNTVLRGLYNENVLAVVYRNRKDIESSVNIHPHGLLQRGSRLYLYALKESGSDLRMYALDRFKSAEELKTTKARLLPNFDLKEKVREGEADFSDAGKKIALKAVVRGYVKDLLYDCPLNDTQIILPNPDDEYSDIVTATMISCGALLRWVLGCGSNITVLEPIELRENIQNQIQMMAEAYSKLEPIAKVEA